MKGRFPGLLITGGNESYSFSYRGSGLFGSGAAGKTKKASDSTPTGSSLPYFYLDESLTSLEFIENIPLSDVALIRFNPPPFPMAPFNGGFLGAICIYLKKGGLDASGKMSSIADNYKQYVFKGFAISREFYSPDYSPQASTKIEDNRTTLYWNPNLLFDEKGICHFSFYNSDHVKKIYIQVEGMSNDGRLLHYDEEVK
jgi:hypothetical protein